MIEKREMFTIICDHCKKDIGSEDEYSCWGTDSDAEDNARDYDWEKRGDKHYCPDCFSWNDEDEQVLDEKRKNKYQTKP